MSAVPTWLTTILIAVATTIVVQLTVGPRLQARTRRILDAHAARDQFSARVLTILSATARLQAFEIPDGTSARMRNALQDERQRWTSQIDEATKYLVDNIEQYALGYARRAGIRDLAVRYAMAARGVWISERSLTWRIELLGKLTGPIQTIFFAYWWHRIPNLAEHRRELLRLLGELENPDR